MSQWLIKLRSALDFDPVGALVHGCDDNAGIVELTLDHPELVRLGRRASVVVDDCHKVVANVTFLLGALWVTLPENTWSSLRRHQYKKFHSNLLGIIVAT